MKTTLTYGWVSAVDSLHQSSAYMDMIAGLSQQPQTQGPTSRRAPSGMTAALSDSFATLHTQASPLGSLQYCCWTHRT